MSNRERWVIYPLLLFSFLLAARDKYVKPENVSYATVTCKRLTISSDEGRPLVTLGASDTDAGALIMHGPIAAAGLPGAESQSPDNLRAPGYRTVEMGANEDGGYVRVFGARPGLDLHVGHDAELELSGYAAVDEHNQFVQSIADQEAESDEPVWGAVMDWDAHKANGKSEAESDEKDASGRADSSTAAAKD